MTPVAYKVTFSGFDETIRLETLKNISGLKL
jgi:hypothetical protein